MTENLAALPGAQTNGTQGVTAKAHCLVCGAREFRSVLDLGEQAIGSEFRSAGAPNPRCAPLELTRCLQCSFVQLAQESSARVATPSAASGFDADHSANRYLARLGTQVGDRARLQHGDLAIDIGDHGGALLASYAAGVTRVGVTQRTPERGTCDRHIPAPFSFDAVAPALAGGRARAITSIAVFDHITDPRRFAADVRRCLADDGLWVVELGYLPAMLHTTSYDSICHSNAGYYRITTFERLLNGLDLEIVDVEFSSREGGSFRLFVAPCGSREKTEQLAFARARESRLLLDTDAPYAGFAHQVKRSRAAVRRFFQYTRRAGRSVWGYGASLKGMVTLQHCALNAEHVIAIADRNDDRIGTVTPGTDIPVRAEQEMRAAHPDYLFVLPWHRLDEVLDRERPYLEAGGKIVVPLPEFRIYTTAVSRGGPR